MTEHHKHMGDTVEDTVRLEAFSDAVYAIIATLLVLELKIPALTLATSADITRELWHILPEFTAFFFSFFVIAIFWVNHHHFYHNVARSDWKLMWYNNFHLFWIATIPFTTALIGKYHDLTAVVVLYSLNMLLAAWSIMKMTRHAFFKSDLLHPGFSEADKRAEYNRGMRGVYLYLAAAITAFINIYIALAILVITPILFIIPRLLSNNEK